MVPKISIIIANYNKAKYLEETLDSALNQNYPNYDIIFIDDCSSDDSWEIVQKYKDRIKLFKNTVNSGVIYTRTKGIGLTDAEYIMFLDSDDKIYPTSLSTLIIPLTLNPKLGISYSQFYANYKTYEILIQPIEYSLPRLMVKDYIPVCNIFRKQSFLDVGGFDPNFSIGAEDWELWIAMGNMGWKGQLVHEPLFWYRAVTENSRMAEADKKFYQICTQLYNKYKNIYDQGKITPDLMYSVK